MKYTVRAFVLAAAVLSSACAGNQYEWHNIDKTMPEFYRDRAECASMSNSVPNRSGVWANVSGQWSDNVASNLNRGLENMSDNQDRQRIFNDCMLGRGWAIVPRDK